MRAHGHINIIIFIIIIILLLLLLLLLFLFVGSWWVVSVIFGFFHLPLFVLVFAPTIFRAFSLTTSIF